MNKQEFTLFATALKTAYSREKELLPNQQSMAFWYELLKDISYQDASKALQRWATTERWSPTIADIRKMVASLNDEAYDDWTEGWSQVTRAIRNYGYCNEPDALKSMDEITRECVKAIGWVNICNSEEIGVERGHFRTMYEQRKDRVRKSEVIPNALKNPVELKLVGFGKTLDELTG